MQVRPTLPAIYICKHFLKNEKRQVETMVSRKKKEKIDLAVTSHNSPLGSSFQLQDDCISIHAIRRLIGQQTLESHFLTMNCTHIYNTNSKKKKKKKKRLLVVIRIIGNPRTKPIRLRNLLRKYRIPSISDLSSDKKCECFYES